ncbi:MULTISPECIES: DUF3618 domain-containing protein [unclassified Streptomyces]|uniref:DUF3618 domain-containing protein n=1 Tax=unclassified Streptomyces TaxID=2593676 RepID=UPI0001C1A76C|nr:MULTISPECIES: DUF3618 domain-containing protein [unclassified Streptomyces]AEN08380.1 Late embryogenesis abundant protein [Streptomyces sp. SirexAA-E]MYR66363.1 DUF3618 domain-containing protein [Streptomyces sp. SID4939]MYS03912.1 DUF3618 domain-containing protein [Streptomyces sp. SID4940]MYT66476.1 DUF3618 domain-containing protein [Streptomyces sp. SID8357]MYT83397.1 DUF3618 domain-containing protein [Streptomyces sp. SID8360]
MTDNDDRPVPTPAELRAQVEETRDELGRTVEALAGKADIKNRAQEKTAEVKDRAQEKTAEVKDRAQEKTAEIRNRAQEKGTEVRNRAQEAAGQARIRLSTTAHTLGGKVQDHTPEPVRENAGRAVEAARNRPGVLLAVGTAALVVLLVARRRGRH